MCKPDITCRLLCTYSSADQTRLRLFWSALLNVHSSVISVLHICVSSFCIYSGSFYSFLDTLVWIFFTHDFWWVLIIFFYYLLLDFRYVNSFTRRSFCVKFSSFSFYQLELCQDFLNTFDGSIVRKWLAA